MVRPENLKQFFDDALELAGFIMAQEIAISPFTPVDTGRLRSSFPGTYNFSKSSEGFKWNFKTPFYTEFVHNGTRKLKARPFIIQTFNQKFPRILKQALRIKDNEYRAKGL